MQKTSLVILATGLLAFGFWAISDYMARRGEVRGDIASGKEIAEQTCLRCHTEFEGEPHPDAMTAAAPALASFGQRWPLENLEEALAEGISVSHDDTTMPEFSFTPQTIADLLAYLGELTREADAQAR